MLGNIILGLVFFGTCHGIFENCDYYEELVPNKPYFVYSPEHPNSYPPGKSCRWYLVSPPQTKINLVCDEFNIPSSKDCEMDRLAISLGGNIDLSDIKNYCNDEKVNVLSNENRLNLVLLTFSDSPGGSFSCRLWVEGASNNSSVFKPDDQCTCGHINGMRIVGGTETGVNEYPMMAALVDGTERELFCGATIISQRFALTAAHCLVNKKPQNVALLVGDHDISTGNDTDSAKVYITERFYTHPEYNTVNQNDIALVAVREKIQFSREVGPACLPFLNTRDSFAGETVYALGWGMTEFLGQLSKKLLHVPLDVVTLEQCKPAYGDRVSERQMCTYGEGKDSCVGDSGGPLLWMDLHSRVAKTVGIVSYGIFCATPYPSVNTRVTSYLDWIKDTTREDFCVL